jgi:hypothetical protein
MLLGDASRLSGNAGSGKSKVAAALARNAATTMLPVSPRRQTSSFAQRMLNETAIAGR